MSSNEVQFNANDDVIDWVRCDIFVFLQAINPILILLFIPFFDYVVYPLLDKCHIPNRWGFYKWAVAYC